MGHSDQMHNTIDFSRFLVMLPTGAKQTYQVQE